MNPEGLTKSGLIVGMGETREEVLGALADMRAVGIDIITIGQCLRPPPVRPIHRYVHPDEFAEYKTFGESLGIPTSNQALGPLQLSRQGEPGGGPGEHRLLKTPSTYGQMRSTPPESIKR